MRSTLDKNHTYQVAMALPDSQNCRKCGSLDFGCWTSSTSGSIHYYCRNCRRRRAEEYTARKRLNGGKHTAVEWRNKLSQYTSCSGCNREWAKVPPRPDKRYKFVWTKDHIVPLSLGGLDDINNIQPLCYQCNSAKCNGRILRVK